MSFEAWAACNLENGNLYREYRPGKTISFVLKKIDQKGQVTESPQSITIGDVKGGGFYGRVLIPEDSQIPYIVKTTLPDAWHDFWRQINWGLEHFRRKQMS